jgi:hypothetical protein
MHTYLYTTIFYSSFHHRFYTQTYFTGTIEAFVFAPQGKNDVSLNRFHRILINATSLDWKDIIIFFYRYFIKKRILCFSCSQLNVMINQYSNISMVDDQLNETILMCLFKFNIIREKSNAFDFQSSNVNNWIQTSERDTFLCS